MQPHAQSLEAIQHNSQPWHDKKRELYRISRRRKPARTFPLFPHQSILPASIRSILRGEGSLDDPARQALSVSEEAELFLTFAPLSRTQGSVRMGVTSRTIEMPRPRAGRFVYWLDSTRIPCGDGHQLASFSWQQVGESIHFPAWPSPNRPCALRRRQRATWSA